MHYDLIIIGSGPGGGSVAHRLAPTGKRILILERGDYLARERDNWNSKTVFVDGKYQVTETWYGRTGESFRPGLHYYIGGNSKVYGAALFRLRERDFEEVRHSEGVSPAWPLRYSDFEPYYAEAEALFHVHGRQGEDPTEPPRSGEFPYPPVSHEALIQDLSQGFAKQGLNPFHLPLGILLEERNGKATPTSICIRCDAFDGFPCLFERQSRLAGDLHRSDAGASQQRDATHKRLCLAPGYRCIGAKNCKRPSEAQWFRRNLLSRSSRGGLRSLVIRLAVSSFKQ